MKRQVIKTQLLALGLGLVTAATANANLITNGSFETHDIFNSGSWGYFDGTAGHQVAGWTSATQNVPLEVGTAGTYGVSGQAGNDVMELDSTANVQVDQNLITVGSSYALSFLYAARQNVATSSDSFDVLWNNIVIATLTPNNTVMALFTTTVTGTGSDTLSFIGKGTSDSYGALIDDVKLEAPSNTIGVVPEPSTWLAGALLVLPMGIQGLRKLRQPRQIA